MQLTDEIETKSALIHATLIIDNLEEQYYSPSQKMMATCQCDPPNQIWVKTDFLENNEITCEHCKQDFQF